MRINKDTESEIIIKTPIWFRVIAWIVLVVDVPIVIWGLVMILVGAGDEWYELTAYAFLLFLLGIWMVSIGTKIFFDKHRGYLILKKGHVPILFWIKRKRIISKEEARSVFVTSFDRPKLIWNLRFLLFALGAIPKTANFSATTYYKVKLLTKSGKEVELLTSSKMELANYLVYRILDFSTQSEVTEGIMSTHPPSPSTTTGLPTAGLEVAVEYMGFWIRFAATTIDILAILAISLLFTYPLELLVLLLPFFLPWPYFLLFTGLKGQTLGKMLLRIKVVSTHGGKPGLGRAYLREFLGKLIFTIPLFLAFTGFLPWFGWVFTSALFLGVLWIAWDRRKQGWHDKIAGMYVIKVMKTSPV